jgi:hypothetical protein
MYDHNDYVCTNCEERLNSIVEVIQHDCDPVPLDARTLAPGFRGLLMYIESCVVDEGGMLDCEKMNHEDISNLKLFQAAGLVEVSEPTHPDHMVGVRVGRTVRPEDRFRKVESFADEAWDVAAACRKLRAINSDRVDFPVGSME